MSSLDTLPQAPFPPYIVPPSPSRRPARIVGTLCCYRWSSEAAARARFFCIGHIEFYIRQISTSTRQWNMSTMTGSFELYAFGYGVTVSWAPVGESVSEGRAQRPNVTR